MITKRFFILMFVTMTLSSIIYAQEKFGVGFMLGEPTGLAWKYRISQANAVDGAIGFSPFDQYRIHVDYLWQSYPFHDLNASVYYGVGGAVGFGHTSYFVYTNNGGRYFLGESDMGFAARVPVGLAYNVPRSPVNLFAEVAPLLILGPSSGLGMDAGVGIRFFFQ